MIPHGSIGAAAAALRTALAALTDEAPTEAQLLLVHATGLSRSSLLAHADRSLTPAALASLNAALDRRLDGEPLAYILGRREFFGLDFDVTPAVLIPRPETELLVERVIELSQTLFADKPLLVADLGTGSGCIAVSLAVRIPRVHIYALDRSREALQIAARNAQRHRVLPRIALVEGDMADPLPAPVDILVSNPPYVPSDEAAAMTDWSVSEPRLALDGGPDGLDFYRSLIPGVAPRLRRPGVALLEIGSAQAAAVLELARASGADQVTLRQDLAGLDRVVELVFD